MGDLATIRNDAPYDLVVAALIRPAICETDLSVSALIAVDAAAEIPVANLVRASKQGAMHQIHGTATGLDGGWIIDSAYRDAEPQTRFTG